MANVSEQLLQVCSITALGMEIAELERATQLLHEGLLGTEAHSSPIPASGEDINEDSAAQRRLHEKI